MKGAVASLGCRSFTNLLQLVIIVRQSSSGEARWLTGVKFTIMSWFEVAHFQVLGRQKNFKSTSLEILSQVSGLKAEVM